MYRPTTPGTRPARRGTILIVVLALLALFAVIGISFVFYADGEATISRIHRESVNNPLPTAPDATTPVSKFLSDFIFGPQDTDLSSVVRGHDLNRSMNGWGGVAGQSNSPYTGIGTFHENLNTLTPTFPVSMDSAQWVNYSAVITDGTNFFFRDPEWTGFRSSGPSGAAPTLNAPLGRTYIPKNAPYTYADLNNLYLAAISPVTGEVLTPSFHRNWLFPLTPPHVSGGNQDWLNPAGRAKILRPRPIDQLTSSELGSIGLYPVPATLTAAQVTSLNTLITSKIASGDLFPYVPVNPDGTTYTGDVQNLMGGVGQLNPDSILLDLGLPPQQWNGKYIKPLVSVLVQDLCGSLNLNAIGNLANSGTTHASYKGYGPWEISLARAFDASLSNATLMTEANSIVAARQTATTGYPMSRGLLSTLPYDRTNGAVTPTRLPAYSLVNWRGNGTGTAPVILPPAFPAPAAFQTSPTYGTGFGDNTDTTVTWAQNHPGLWNPNEWGDPPTTGPTTGFTFPLSDLRRLRLRYADMQDNYNQMTLARPVGTTASPPSNWLYPVPNGTITYLQPKNSLIGDPNGTDSPTNYRLDAAHPNRFLFTTRSAGLDRPGLMPNFSTSPGTLQLTASTLHPFNPAFTGAFAGGSTTDFGGATGAATDWRNPRAGLGTIDLNRPLTDYRNDTTAALDPGNVDMTVGTGKGSRAWADRHNLARDIFARLIVATGANATVDPATGNVTINATPTTTSPGNADFNALRYLAQVAVNMVDAIDSDDVSTMFVWNTNATAAGGVLTAVDATSVQTIATAVTTATIRNQVVFGVEKPRLVINEAYGEVTNDPGEAGDKNTFNGINPSASGHVRFWLELLNPTSAPYAGGTNGPLGDGSAQLRYPAAAPTPFSPYRVVITRNTQFNKTGTVADELQKADNVLGDLPSTFVADIACDLSTIANLGANQQKVSPNNGAYDAQGVPSGNVAAQGIAIIGPQLPAVFNDAIEFKPDVTAAAPAPWSNMIQVPVTTPTPTNVPRAPTASQNAMNYFINNVIGLNKQTLQGADPRRHVVLLRRLANPYLPPNDPNVTTPAYNTALPMNPYVTVDVMDWVQAYDAAVHAVGRVAGDTPSTRTKRYSIGKVQPYAGYINPNTDYNPAAPGTDVFLNFPTPAFPSMFVVPQNPTTPVNAADPKHTFGRHNGQAATPGPAAATFTAPATLNDTLMAPFDWLVHFDRLVANPMELMSLQAVKPHEVTQYFLQPPANAGESIRRSVGQVPWFGVNATTGQATTGQPLYNTTTGYHTPATTGQTNNGLFRSLDLLRVKPWGYGVGLGGRIHGRVNVNTIQDKRVLLAVLDPQAANGFTSADVDTLWTNLIGSRTRNFRTTTTAGGTSVTVPDPSFNNSGQISRTIDDDPTFTNPDRPFKPFTVGEYTSSATATAAAGGSGLADTLLRPNAAGVPQLWVQVATWTMGTSYTTGQRVVSNGLVYVCTNAGTSTTAPTGTGTVTDGTPPNALTWSYVGPDHPYLRAEMAQKLLNNVTTVSNTFAVTMTVVFHEVRMSGTTPQKVTEGGVDRYLLGKEAYLNVPGDLRQQYFAVVDRSNIGLVPNSTTFQSQPFYTSIEPTPTGTTLGPNQIVVAAAADGSGNAAVYADGVAVPLLNSTLAIGVGSSAEPTAFTVTVATPVANGVSVLTLSGNLAKTHYPGECVSNVVPGNPGPQAAFDRVTNANSQYKMVVPYLARVSK